MIPETYEAWHRCMTHSCRIDLTPDFLAQRLAELKEGRSYDVARFRELYGEAHWTRVIAWFERALAEARHDA